MLRPVQLKLCTDRLTEGRLIIISIIVEIMKPDKDPAMKRLHVHISVTALDKAVDFYSALFAAEPTVRKDDYAKWMLDDPRVNFAISTRTHASGRSSPKTRWYISAMVGRSSSSHLFRKVSRKAAPRSPKIS